LLIDCEEDPTLGAVLVEMLRAERHRDQGDTRSPQKNGTSLTTPTTDTATASTRITGRPIATYIAAWRLSRP
jgi:hypothetical protein